MNAPSIDHSSGFGLGRDHDTRVEEVTSSPQETRHWVVVTEARPRRLVFKATGLTEFFRILERDGGMSSVEDGCWSAAYKTAAGKIRFFNHHHPEMVTRIARVMDDSDLRDSLEPATYTAPTSNR